jgi:isoamylase
MATTYLESVMTDTTPRRAFAIESGSPHPLGASPGREGVNFSLFSTNATGVELLLFARMTRLSLFR